MKFWQRFTGKVKKRVIGGALAIVLGVAGISVSPAVSVGAVEFLYILSEGGEDAGQSEKSE